MARLILIVLLFALGACTRKPEPAQIQRHYALTGRVLALNAKDQTATVDAAAIPNFMEAMTMEYPIKSKADFEKLHVGDKITATVNASSDGLYDLSNVQRQSPGSAQTGNGNH
ncbi:MAG TPA: copper-binding protein [Bryobacteraceae bacterium]|nr:copper-binding protein [Bryobacteraceae bacterium]